MLFGLLLMIAIFLIIVLGPFLQAMGLKWTKDSDAWRRKALEEMHRERNKNNH